MTDLGHFGNHELYMKSSDYQKGVLTDFVFFTLPYTIPAEVFSAPIAPPGQTKPGARPHLTPQSIAPSVPSGAPVTNEQRAPADRPSIMVLPGAISQ
jgi:hypothetical protein